MSNAGKRSRAAESEEPRKKQARINIDRIERGLDTFTNKTVRVQFECERIFCTDCRVVGNNLNVVGDRNSIYGANNRANGVFNKFFSEQMWLERKAESRRRAETASSSTTAATTTELRSAPVPQPRPAVSNPPVATTTVTAPVQTPLPPQSGIMPPHGQDPRQSPWKRMVGDLEGEPKACTVEELQCIVCYENRFDVLFEPCHHQVTCVKCAKLLQPTSGALPQCPMCRKPIELSTVVFSA